MSEEQVSWHKYVPPELVAAYEALGWIDEGEMPMPHGAYKRRFMSWIGDGAPVEPSFDLEGVRP